MSDAKWTVVFHDDMDGVISAAIFSASHTVERLVPMASHQRKHLDSELKKLKDKEPGSKIAVLDYAYSKYADLWIDHHWAAKAQLAEAKKRSDAGNLFYMHDIKKPSAARIVAEQYNEGSENIGVLAMWADRYDTADFASADYTLTSKGVFNQMYAALEITNFQLEHRLTACTLVKICKDFICNYEDLGKAMKRTGFDDDIVSHLQARASRIKKDMVTFGKLSIVNSQFKQYPRYAEYYSGANIKYACRFEKFPGNSDIFRFSLSYNKWGDDRNFINLGELIRNCYCIRGGGHKNVAGGTVLSDDLDKAVDYLTYHLSNMNDEEVDMEKYGVDADADSVERDAEELSKEAGISKDEARKKVAGKIEGKSADKEQSNGTDG